MKYIIECDKKIEKHNIWQDFPKFLFFIFLVYINWYKEIWGDKQILLYGSVILLTASIFFPFGEKKENALSFHGMPVFIKVLLAFGIYSFITGIIVCINRTSFISSMLTYFCFLVVLFDCCIISQRDNSWEWLLKSFLLVSLLCAFYTMLRGQPLRNGGATVISMGSNNNPNTLAHILLIGLFGLVAINKEGNRHLLIKLAISLLLSYIIILTGSRKSLIAIGALLLIWIYSILKIVKMQKKPETTIAVALGIFLAAIIIGWFFFTYYKDSDQFSRFLKLFDGEEDSANEDRIKMYQLAFNIWKEHPIFGVGFNQYKYYSWRGDYSHSVYAEVLSCTGLLGTIILFCPVIKSTINVANNIYKTNGNDRYIYSMCLAGLFTEFLLGVGQIWIYGINHELYLLCILGLYENQFNNAKFVNRKEKIQKCHYIRN